jgi:hypothetical protein
MTRTRYTELSDLIKRGETVHRYTIYGKPAPGTGIFHNATYHKSWAQEVLQRDAPDAWQAVFNSDPLNSIVPMGQPDGVERELSRLLPWVDRAAVRREPSTAVYCGDHGRELNIDAWDESLVASVEACIAVLLDQAKTRVPEASWASSHRCARLSITPARRRGYFLPWLRVSEERAAPAAVAGEMGHLVYEGLVSAAMRDAMPESALARIPAFEQSGFYLELAPVRAHGRVAQRSTKPMYRRAEFSMDLAVEGDWRVGGGGLFGYGRVKAES